jgi:starch synthase
MSILFGHPTGNPNSHQAALAHFEAGRLEAFCVPWMPSSLTLHLLNYLGPLRPMTRRLSRRHFPSLDKASKVQGRVAEMGRLLTRAFGRGNERLSYEANDWLMRTMRRECRRSAVTTVHAYEDCSLLQFFEAKRLGKACIYDMPIGYYSAFEKTQAELTRIYADWLPTGGLLSSRYVRPKQKRQEMSLADLVLVPSTFVANTIREFHPDKRIEIAPYGTDSAVGLYKMNRHPQDVITFLFVGQCSLRKGIPLLLEAWRDAGLKHARLQLVGSWQLAEAKQKSLPPRAEWIGPVSKDRLRDYYDRADIFVLPTYFEGRALVIGEALSSGLPVLTTPASGAEDLIDDTCGRLVPTGNFDALVESLRWFDKNRELFPTLSRTARARAEGCTWENYRRRVSEAVTPFV